MVKITGRFKEPRWIVKAETKKRGSERRSIGSFRRSCFPLLVGCLSLGDLVTIVYIDVWSIIWHKQESDLTRPKGQRDGERFFLQRDLL